MIFLVKELFLKPDEAWEKLASRSLDVGKMTCHDNGKKSWT